MTPEQVKRALQLYSAYKTDTVAYRELAEQLGMSTGELNSRCWYILAERRKATRGAHQ